MKIPRICIVVGIIFAGRASAYTLRVTTCNASLSLVEGAHEDTITFHFCEGGSYCEPLDEVKLPAHSGIDVNGGLVEIPVDVGYVPTTMEIRMADGASDWWRMCEVVWERGDNLLGEDSSVALDSETGEWGCIGGLTIDGPIIGVCKKTWRFFNVKGSTDYKYDVRVKACDETNSSSVMGYFCSHSSCNGTVGEEVQVPLQMNDEVGGWTLTQFNSTFNPVAMRLEKVDESWCADKVTFNLFLVVSGPLHATEFETTTNGIPSMIVHNVQDNGMTATPSPSTSTVEPSPGTNESANDSKFLDAAWEVAVTVIGALIVATVTAATSVVCRRRRVASLLGPKDESCGKAFSPRPTVELQGGLTV